METKQETPKGMILYSTKVVELLHLRRECYKGVPLITVFDVEAQNFKYGKEAYCNIIKKQIKEVFDFTLRNEKEAIPQYYDETFEKGIECKITEVNQNNNFVYYYFNHEVETKILYELLEYLQNNTIEIEKASTNTIEKQKSKYSNITALQWSAIFYYVEPDMYGEIQLKKDKLTKFRKDFNVSNSQPNLSNKHNEIVRVINGDKKNELKQKHINAIEAILPYLEKKYHEAFENAKDDLSILKDELDRK